MKKLALLLAAVASLFTVDQAEAARRGVIASGNVNAAATWGVIDSASFSASEAVSTAVGTSALSSAAFTPAAQTLTAIAFKLSARLGTTGTVTVKLANSTAPGTRECSTNINASDLPTAGDSYATVGGGGTAGGLEGGWIAVACAAAPNGTDSYTLQLTAGSAGQLKAWAASGNNWSRMLISATTGAPAAGDQLYIQGKFTAPATQTAYVVTINTTTLTNYGATTNLVTDPSISISKGGSYVSGTSVSTAYVAEHAGAMVIYNGGTFSLGTSGTPVPLTSTMVYTLNGAAEEDTGIEVRNGGTLNAVGVSAGRNVVKALLATTATVSVTSTLTTNVNTGWLSGDSLVMAGSRISDGTGGYDTSAGWDVVTMNANATTTSVPLAAAPTRWTHTAQTLDYTSAQTGVHYHMDMFPAIVNITRNVTITGSGATTGSYIYAQQAATFFANWVRFDQLTGVNAMRRGIEIDIGGNYTNGTNSGAFNLTNAAITNARRYALGLGWGNNLYGGSAGAYAKVQHVAMYNVAYDATSPWGIFLAGTSNPYEMIDDFTIIRSAYASGYAARISSHNGQFTDFTMNTSGSCGNGCGVAMNMSGNYNSRDMGAGQVGNVWGPLYFYGNNGIPIFGIPGCLWNFTIAGVYIWHEVSWFNFPNNDNCGDVTVDPMYMISSAAGLFASGRALTLKNGVMGFDVNQGSGYMYATEHDAGFTNMTFENMEICPPTGALGGVTWVACQAPFSILNDIDGCCDTPSNAQFILRNTSTPGAASLTSFPTAIAAGQEPWLGPKAFIVSDCNGCPTKHWTLLAGGLLSYDTAITHATGFSLRMTPRVMTFSGYIAGNTLNMTAGAGRIGTQLTSNATSPAMDPATVPIAGAGAGPPYFVSPPQTLCSSGSPCQFQSYREGPGGLLRLQSAPYGQGTKIAVKSGTVASVCAWVRPSVNTDGAAVWGAAAVTYNGDQPRLINRQNPYMGVASDTALTTTFTPAYAAGTWSQACANLPSPSADGVFEVTVDADQTFTSNPGGSVNVTEWSCTNCGDVNTGQFWANGIPLPAVQPLAGRTLGGG